MNVQTAPAPAQVAAPPASASQPLMKDDWHPWVNTAEFKDLLLTKKKVISYLLGVSLAFFFIVLLLAGYNRPLMAEKVSGSLNIGYVLVIAIYLASWGAALLYTFTAHRVFDPLAAKAAKAASDGRAGA